MPIKISDSLPARAVLEQEHIFVMTEYRALHQDIRPLKICILNLMPTKIATETQILRCLANTPLQIEIDLLQTKSHVSTHTPEDHLLTFYQTFDEIKNQFYDGLIITGALRLNIWLLKRWNIGRSFAASWNGARPMSNQRFIFVGRHRRRFTIIMASQSIRCRKSFPVFLPIVRLRRNPVCSAALMMFIWYRIQGTPR